MFNCSAIRSSAARGPGLQGPEFAARLRDHSSCSGAEAVARLVFLSSRSAGYNRTLQCSIRQEDLTNSFTLRLSKSESLLRLCRSRVARILGNVEGVDVTVEHVASLEESELLKIDYGTALDKFRRVSKLKQAWSGGHPSAGCHIPPRSPHLLRPRCFACRRPRPLRVPAACPGRAGDALGGHAPADFH